MKQYELFELILPGEAPSGSHAIVDIDAIFTCNGIEHHVKGFYDGIGNYKIRFLPEECGLYNWKVYGAVTAEGQEECVKGDNHGFVQAEGCHFRYEDGTRYTPFGTTVYALIHQEEEIIEKTMKSLRQAPFNKIRFCIFPKSYEFNENEPEYFAFKKDTSGKWDVNRPDPVFWNRLEKMIQKLAEMGIQSDLILFHSYDRWGFDKMSREENEIYLRYAIRRLAAFPSIWWSMANEYDICFKKTEEDWFRFEEIIKEEDPYGHLLSNHYCMKPYDYSRENITHCSMQNILFFKGPKWMKKFGKPVVYDECCYEGNIRFPWGNISAAEMVHRFWCAYSIGAFATHGETYLSEDDVLWWAKGGELKGKSPEGIAFLRRIIEELPSAVEYWKEPENLLLGAEFLEKNKETGILFYQRMASLSEMEDDAVALKDMSYSGRCGEEAFIKYYGIQCPAKSFIILPENHTYSVEIIDTRNYTRETVLTGVSGINWFDMPGREGMAVLAKRESE